MAATTVLISDPTRSSTSTFTVTPSAKNVNAMPVSTPQSGLTRKSASAIGEVCHWRGSPTVSKPRRIPVYLVDLPSW